MTTGSPTPDDIRQHAVDDYLTSGDTYAIVAARHGVSRAALHSWVNPNGVKKRKPKTWAEDELAYLGSSDFDPKAWEVRGGVLHPLLPERRSA